MANLSSIFREFNNSIKVSENTIDTIESRMVRVKNMLDNCYYGSIQKNTHLLVGSIGRKTDIHVSDVDVIYKLPGSEYTRYNNYYSNGQQRLLQDFRMFILQTYPNTYVKADKLVAVIEFSDGVVFEIMPAFINNDNSFTYPSSSNGGSWGNTNPLPEIAAMNAIQAQTAGNARKLARMVRAWKDVNNVNMGGLLIDTYVYDFMSQYEYKDKPYNYYDWISRDFFKYLFNQNDQLLYIHALGSNQRIYLKGRFVNEAKKAYQNTLDAISAFDSGYYYTSVSNWKNIYGSKFKLIE